MEINNMTVNEFRKLPHRKWDKDIGTFDSLIILPDEINHLSVLWYWVRYFLSKIFSLKKPDLWEIEGLHDSGYRCMDFVAVKNNKPLCLLSGCSDVIHIDGIGGYGKDWLKKYGTVPTTIPPSNWSIDCLPKSGLLRLFAREITCGGALSSLEVYTTTKKGGK